jgi:hypothetical protein
MRKKEFFITRAAKTYGTTTKVLTLIALEF